MLLEVKKMTNYEMLKDKPMEGSMGFLIEQRLLTLFSRLFRKDGKTPMAFHSIRVGRDLIKRNSAPEVVFSGYYHDVPEDIKPYSEWDIDRMREWLYKEAQAVHLTVEQAYEAVNTTMECIYQRNEIEAEKAIGGYEGKLKRKEMACERWGNGSLNVMLVKSADIRDNKADCQHMGETFIQNYNAWADPLYKTMQKRIKEITL